ncbi:uncharacterized protein LOC112189601 isoform X2 [Rosa chinensis]|uniref:uncharacterized protein LOC112189601 isoform X2 n=1 Tax=Rosa chinensis TaxID=74649 RepID=UPI001AD8D191|nr:uncharacterized protein LOC112189601 isoform X2 [Rosa chinensis]
MISGDRIEPLVTNAVVPLEFLLQRRKGNLHCYDCQRRARGSNTLSGSTWRPPTPVSTDLLAPPLKPFAPSSTLSPLSSSTLSISREAVVHILVLLRPFSVSCQVLST